MAEIFHSVRLNKDKCKGCSTCVKRCPTQAIRVRDGKAKILEDLCIDCGECIRVCPHRAKKAVCTPLAELKNSKYQYKIALPPPSLYCQFNHLEDVDFVLSGLLSIGFDSVFEVSAAAEIISDFTREYMAQPDINKPVISGACPAIVRLIETRFHHLCDNILPFVAPVELAAMMARRQAAEKTGLSQDEIGVFFISPCPAKVTEAILHPNTTQQLINGAFSMSEIYIKLVGAMNRIENPEPLLKSGILGVSWAISGGEAGGLLTDKYLAADGIENAIKILEQVEDDKLAGVDFIELNACTSGCIGGCLTVENPFIAKSRLKSLRRYMPVSQNKSGNLPAPLSPACAGKHKAKPSVKLSDNLDEAMKMMLEIERLTEMLPDLDCGACGAPTCAALAEDVVRGKSSLSLCVYLMREKLRLIRKNLTPEQLAIYYDNEKSYEELSRDDG